MHNIFWFINIRKTVLTDIAQIFKNDGECLINHEKNENETNM